jgi:hypothetical protein
VLAYVDAPDDGRKHLQLRFHANLSIAEQVSYLPPESCDNLVGTTTVAEALDRLCNIGGEPGFHVDGLFWQTPQGTEVPARHDTEVAIALFTSGLRIRCDLDPEPSTIKQASVFMRVELPMPDDPFFLQDFIVNADLAVNAQSVLWRPAAATANLLKRIAAIDPAPTHVLARLTLKGNNIWQLDKPNVHLDGEVTSTPDGATPHNLRLPSGDGKRGGDFETWFRIRIENPGIRGDIVVAGVLHPTTMVGLNTTRLVRNQLVVVEPARINQRLDALDQAYDHQEAVQASGLDGYVPADIPFNRDRAIELLTSSELPVNDLIVNVWIEQSVQELGLRIIERWSDTFAPLDLKFVPEIVPEDAMEKLPDTFSGNRPVSLVIAASDLMARLDADPTLGQFLDATFMRRI